MSELTREKKCQIAALGAKGKNAEEIAEIAKVDIEAVKALLATRDTEKNTEPTKEEIATMNRKEIKEYAVRLYNQGKTRKEIMEITGLSRSTVYTLIPVEKDKKPRKFKKVEKKEPAPAATDTDSNTKNEIKNLSTNNDTIDFTVCQDALERAEKTMLAIYNNMSESEQRAWDLGEAFAEMVRARGLFV